MEGSRRTPPYISFCVDLAAANWVWVIQSGARRATFPRPDPPTGGHLPAQRPKWFPNSSKSLILHVYRHAPRTPKSWSSPTAYLRHTTRRLMRPTKSKGWGGTEEGPRNARDLAGDECARGGRSDMLAKHHTAATDACMVLEVVSAL